MSTTVSVYLKKNIYYTSHMTVYSKRKLLLNFSKISYFLTKTNALIVVFLPAVTVNMVYSP